MTLGESTKDPTTLEALAKAQDELEWRTSGCWIALYIYYST